MTSNVLFFRVARPTPLVCVWQATGNPKRPLIRRWMIAETPASAAAEAGWRLCA